VKAAIGVTASGPAYMVQMWSPIIQRESSLLLALVIYKYVMFKSAYARSLRIEDPDARYHIIDRVVRIEENNRQELFGDLNSYHNAII
jgi:hypothetical protein